MFIVGEFGRRLLRQWIAVQLPLHHIYKNYREAPSQIGPMQNNSGMNITLHLGTNGFDVNPTIRFPPSDLFSRLKVPSISRTKVSHKL